jgi:hypothetical protein
MIKIPIIRIDEKTTLLGQPEELPNDNDTGGRFSFFK